MKDLDAGLNIMKDFNVDAGNMEALRTTFLGKLEVMKRWLDQFGSFEDSFDLYQGFNRYPSYGYVINTYSDMKENLDALIEMFSSGKAISNTGPIQKGWTNTGIYEAIDALHGLAFHASTIKNNNDPMTDLPQALVDRINKSKPIMAKIAILAHRMAEFLARNADELGIKRPPHRIFGTSGYLDLHRNLGHMPDSDET